MPVHMRVRSSYRRFPCHGFVVFTSHESSHERAWKTRSQYVRAAATRCLYSEFRVQFADSTGSSPSDCAR